MKKLIILICSVLSIMFPNQIKTIIETLYSEQYIYKFIVIEILFFAFWYAKFSKSGRSLQIYFKPKEDKNLKLTRVKQNIPNIKKVDYYREIPCNGNLVRTFWFLYQYELLRDETDIIGAFLLKWRKEERIKILTNNFNKQKIDLNNIKHSENILENKLIDLFKEAAGENLIIEQDEIKKWCKKNKSFDIWWKLAIREQTEIFEKEGMVYDCKAGKVIAEELNKEAIQVLGFKRFLLEYSLINERTPLEVVNWEDYLVFAQVIGIAEEVVEQFKAVYPEISDIRINDLNYISQTKFGSVMRKIIYICYLFYGFMITFGFNILLKLWEGMLVVIAYLKINYMQ